MEPRHRAAATLGLLIVAGENNHVRHAGEVLGDLLRLHDLAVVVVHIQNDAVRQLEAVKAAAAALKFGRHMVKLGSGLKVGKAGDNPAGRVKGVALVATGGGAKKGKVHSQKLLFW